MGRRLDKGIGDTSNIVAIGAEDEMLDDASIDAIIKLKLRDTIKLKFSERHILSLQGRLKASIEKNDYETN